MENIFGDGVEVEVGVSDKVFNFGDLFCPNILYEIRSEIIITVTTTPILIELFFNWGTLFSVSILIF